MPSTSSNAENITPPDAQTIQPNEQAVFIMDYDPRTVNVENTSNFDGSFLYVWLYATTNAVTPVALPLLSEADATLRPQADGNGNQPRTLVIFNNSGVTLNCSVRQH